VSGLMPCHSLTGRNIPVRAASEIMGYSREMGQEEMKNLNHKGHKEHKEKLPSVPRSAWDRTG